MEIYLWVLLPSRTGRVDIGLQKGLSRPLPPTRPECCAKVCAWVHFFLKKMSTGLSSGYQNDLQPSKSQESFAAFGEAHPLTLGLGDVSSLGLKGSFSRVPTPRWFPGSALRSCPPGSACPRVCRSRSRAGPPGPGGAGGSRAGGGTAGGAEARPHSGPRAGSRGRGRVGAWPGPGPAPAMTSRGPRRRRGPQSAGEREPAPGRLAARAREVEVRERAVGPPERLPPGAADGVLWRPRWPGRPGRGTSRYSPALYWPTLGEGPSPPPAPQHAHLVHRDPARGAPRRPISRPRQGAAAALPSLPFPAALHLRGAPAQQSQGTRGPFPGPSRRGLGFCLLTGVPHSRPLPPRARPAGAQILPSPLPSFPRVSRQGMPPPQVISRLLAAPSPLLRSLPPHPESPCHLPLLDPSTRWLLGS